MTELELEARGPWLMSAFVLLGQPGMDDGDGAGLLNVRRFRLAPLCSVYVGVARAAACLRPRRSLGVPAGKLQEECSVPHHSWPVSGS